MYGFLYEYSEQLSTLALVTHYDSFSVVPELTQGGNNNISGVAAFFELARIFH